MWIRYQEKVHFTVIVIHIRHIVLHLLLLKTTRELFYIAKWMEWVIEWLLFNANSAIFQLYHGEDKFIFNEMMMRSTLY